MRRGPGPWPGFTSESIDAVSRSLLNCEFKMAIRHPLGFVRASLSEFADSDADEELFLHIWPANLADSSMSASHHTHVFHMDSLIIAGSLTNSTWYRTSSSTSRLFQEHQLDYTDHMVSHLLGPVRLRRQSRTDLAAGDSYSVSLGSIHESESGPRGAVTLIRKTYPQPRLLGPRVYWDRAVDNAVPNIEKISASEVRACLLRTLQLT